MPRIERLEQNTPQWQRWRMEGIGSSDAPVIMGEGAFKTRRTLWAIKPDGRGTLPGIPLRVGVMHWSAPHAALTNVNSESRWNHSAWSTTGTSGCAPLWTVSASAIR